MFCSEPPPTIDSNRITSPRERSSQERQLDANGENMVAEDSEAAKDRTDDNAAGDADGETENSAPDGNAPAVARKAKSPTPLLVKSPPKAPGCSFIVTGSLDDKLKIWDWRNEELKLRETLDGHYLGIVSVDVSPDRRCKLLIRKT